MKHLFFLLLVTTTFLCSCASSYHSSNPARFMYRGMLKGQKDSIEYATIFNLFKKAGYTKYANKEKHKQVNMVAVKITNTGTAPITFNEDSFAVWSNGEAMELLKPEEYYEQVKQQKGWYFLWAFFDPAYPTTTPLSVGYNAYGSYIIPPVTTYHSVPVGPFIALYNFFKAKKANKTLLADLKKYQLMGKSVEPGGAAYGYIYIPQPANQSVTISLEHVEVKKKMVKPKAAPVNNINTY